MPARPLVSIVVTSYNYGRYLTECLDSALGQTFPACEVIVIDDGSTDESPEIIRGYGGRLKSVLKANEGPASSWNRGFSLSAGQFVLFLDSDDVLLPTAVADALAGFERAEVVRVQWPLIQIDGDSRRTGGMIPGAELHEGNLRDALLRNGPASYMSAPTSGNLWRRSFLNEVLPVPPQFKMMCDAYLMTMSPLHGEIVALHEPHSLYRTHGKNDYHGMSFLPRLERDIKSFEHRCELLRDYCKKNSLIPDEEGWRRDSWFYRLRNVTEQLQALVPAGEKFLMVENGSWGMDKSVGRVPIPFLEKDGYYNGAPADDETAVAELERKVAAAAVHTPPHPCSIEALDDQHASQMRALALRAFTNSLSVLAEEQPALLKSLLSLQSPGTVAAPVLAALHDDLQGASRPATVSSRLATSHEAALAAKCLGLLAEHSDLAKRTLMNDDNVLLQLEKAMAVGRSTHAVLAAEARRTYHLLTEEDRSC